MKKILSLTVLLSVMILASCGENNSNAQSIETTKPIVKPPALGTNCSSAQECYDKANEFFSSNKMDKAIHYGNKAIQFDPQMRQAYSLVGSAYMNKGDKENGLKFIEYSSTLPCNKEY